MDYCIIKDKIIDNIIVCDDGEAAALFGALPAYEGACIGQAYDPPPDLAGLAAAARAQRDALLKASDWTQVLDAPVDGESLAAYRAYRQALRDVPEQEGFPVDILWPQEPVAVKAPPDPVDDAVDVLLGGERNA